MLNLSVPEKVGQKSVCVCFSLLKCLFKEQGETLEIKLFY